MRVISQTFLNGGEKMSKPKEPIDLIIAKGKKHLTKAEIDERREQEVSVPFKNVEAPDFFSEAQRKEFDEYAEKLLSIGIFTELDVDCLTRYILAKNLYLKYTSLLTGMINKKNVADIGKVQSLQDKAFKQCQQCARDLGLTISSRCKLVIPQTDSDNDEL